MIDRLTRLVRGMVSRGVVRLVDDDRKAQAVQVEVHAGELEDDVERLQPYGFTAVPKAGSEAVILRVGAAPDHPIVIVVEDRRYRLTGLEEGEVALYDDQGQAVILRRDGVEVRTAGDIRLGEGASAGVARVDDTVEVTIPIGTVLVIDKTPGSPTLGQPIPNPAPIGLEGTITAASTTVKAVG